MEYKRVKTIRDRIDQLQSVLDGTLPVHKRDDLNSLIKNYENYNIFLNLINQRVRLLKGNYYLWEEIFSYFSTSYIKKRISKLDLLIKQYISNELFDWIFEDTHFSNKIFYIKIYVKTFRELYFKCQEYDNCISVDILKAEVDSSYHNLLNASKRYVRNKIKQLRSTLSYKDVSLINEYAEALNKFVWRSTSKSIKDAIWRKISLSYPTVLKAFPIWITTNLSADKSIPLLPGMFDYLIIDEASQCDIASALPLMYRAKNVVILGDPFQLRHICTLTHSMDQYLAHRENIDNLWLQMSYRDKSLYDLAEHITGMMDKPVYWLLEHYRCHRSIIGFSNDRFYQNKLIFHDKEYDESDGILTGIVWANVDFNNGTDKTNIDELNYIKEQLKNFSNNELFNKLSVGVVTPFRRQANILNEQLKEFNVVVGTAHRYQGDEKDIMFFSTVINPKTSDRTIKWINHTENLVNVAVSRARRGIVIVGSASQCVRLDGILKDLARYIEIEKVTRITDYKNLLKSQSPAERALYHALVIRGVKPILQYPSVGYLIDIALIGPTKRIAIEVDGEPYHNFPEQKSYDKERDVELSQAGWLTMRFTAKDIYNSSDTVANQIVGSFFKQY
jgi:very-short-patch-repair endonuclease